MPHYPYDTWPQNAWQGWQQTGGNYYHPPYATQQTTATQWIEPLAQVGTTWRDWQQTNGINYAAVSHSWSVWIDNLQANALHAQQASAAWRQWAHSVDDVAKHFKRQASGQRRRLMVQANRARSHKLRRNIAQRRAERLLLEHLSKKQRREYEQGRYFHVETADGRRRYRIALGLVGNVRLVKCKEDPPVKRGQNGLAIKEGSKFCMHVYHPDGPIPDADNVLAQKLLLESEGGEEQFLQLANVT